MVKNSLADKNNIQQLKNKIDTLTKTVSKLKKSDKLLTNAINSAPIGMVTLTIDGKITTVNKAFCQIIGYTKKELLAYKISQITHPDDKHIGNNVIEELTSGKAKKATFEKRYIHKNGTSIHAQVSTVILKDELGIPINFFTQVIDVSKSKQADETIRNSEYKFRVLTESAPIGIYYIDLEGTFIYGNKKVEEIIGYKQEELVGKNFRKEKILNKRDILKASKLLALNLLGKSTGPDSYVINRPDGDQRQVEISTEVINMSGKKVVLGMIRDLTAHNLAEKELKESEEKYRTLLDNAPIGIFNLSANGTYLYGNKKLDEIGGVNPRDVIGRDFAKLKMLNAKDILRATKIIALNMLGKSTGPDHFVINRPDGDQRQVEISTECIKMAGKKVVLGMVRDITDYIQSEKELKESEEKYRVLLDNAPIGIFYLDSNGIYLYGNNKLKDISDYKHGEMTGKKLIFLDLLNKKDKLKAKKLIALNLYGKSTGPDFFVLNRKDGTQRQVEVSTESIKIDGKKVVLGMIRDITAHNLAQKELQESEEKFKNFVETSADLLIRLNKTGHIEYISPRILDLYGYKQDELIGKHLKFTTPISDIPKALKVIKKLLSGKSVMNFEITQKSKAGNIIPVEINAVPVKKDGKIVGMQGIMRDITERKKAEKEIESKTIELEKQFENSENQRLATLSGLSDLNKLTKKLQSEINERRKSEKELAEANKSLEMLGKTVHSMNECASITDKEHKIIFVNEAWEKTYGYKKEEAIGKTSEIIEVKEQVGLKNKMRQQTKLGGWKGELTNKKKDGTIFPTELSIAPLRDAKGSIIAQIGISSDITERKKVEEEIKRLSAVVKSTSQFVVMTTIEGTIVYVNDAYLNKSGYQLLEVLGKHMFEFSPEDSINILKEKTIPALLSIGHWKGEMSVRTKDGDIFPADLVCTLLKNKKNEPEYLVAFFDDITKRKQTEKELQIVYNDLQATMNAIPDFLFEVDDMGHIYNFRAPKEQALYVRSEDFLGKTIIDVLPEDVSKIIMSAIAEALDKGYHRGATYSLDMPDGKHWYELSISIRDSNGDRHERLIALARDVTERINAENKLTASEEKFRGLFDESIAVVYLFDDKKNFIDSNQAGLDLLGYSKEELLKLSIPDVDVDPVVVLPKHQELLSGDRIINYEHKLKRKDGTIITVLNNSRPLVDLDSNVVGMQSTLLDITERKQAEEALRESEQRNRHLVDSIQDIIYTISPDGIITSLSPAFEVITGWKASEWIGKSIEQLMHPDEVLGARKLYKQFIEGAEPFVHELRVKSKSGKFLNLEFKDTIVKHNGTVKEMLGIARDITDCKLAEEKIIKSEERLKEAQRIAQIGNWELNLITNKLYWSDEVYRIFGLKSQEFEATYEAFLDNIHQDDRGMVNKAYKESVENKTPYDIVHRLKLKDGTIKYVNEHCESFYNEAGKAILSIGTVQDITKNKQAQEELKKLSTAIQQSPVSIVITDPQGNIEYVNPRFCELTGYSIEEALGKNPSILKSGEMSKENYKQLWKTISAGKEWRGEFHNKKKNGELYWEEANISAIKNENGNIVNFLAVKEDITERKQAEFERKVVHQALQKSEEKYRQLEENMSDFVFIQDMNLNVTYTSPSIVEYFGYKSEEVRGLSIDNFMTKDSYKKAYESFQIHIELESGKEDIGIPTMEYEFIRKDGSKFWGEARMTFLRDSQKKLLGAQGIVRNITERKQTEEALRESEEKYRAMVESTNTGYLILDKTGKVLDANQEYIRLTGHRTFEEIKGRSVIEWTAEHDLERNKQEVIKCFEKGFVKNLELDYINKKGGIIPIEINAVIIKEKGELQILSIVQDISERKKAEESLRKSEKKYRDLFEKSKDAVLIIHNETFVDCNQATINMLGYKTKDKFLNTHPSELSPEKQPDGKLSSRKANQMMRIALENGSHRFEWDHTRANGEVFPVEVLLTAISNDKKNRIIHTVWRDITERKKADMELMQSEERFKRLFNDLGDAVYVTKLGGKDRGMIIEVNSAAESQTGYTRNELLSMNVVEDLYISGSGYKKAKNWEEELSKGKIFSTTEKKRKKNGKEFWTEVIVTAIEFKGEIASLSINHDITERKQAEEALKESERFHRGLLDDMVSFAAVLKPDGEVIFVNNTPLKVGGIELEDVVGKKFYDCYWWTHSDEVYQSLKKYIKQCAQGLTLMHDIQIQVADGSLMWIEYSMHPYYDENGIVKYLIPEGRDVTARKQAEKALSESENKYRKFFMEDLTGDYLATREGNIIDCNPQFLKIYGFKSLEHAQKYDVNKLHESKSGRKKFIAEIEKNKILYNYQSDQYKVNGEKITTQENVIGEFDDAGKLVNIKGYMFDITDRIDAKQEIKIKTMELEEQFKISEMRRIATLSTLSDLNETTKELQSEIKRRKKRAVELKQYRNHLEDLVKERTVKLEETNKELEAFSYSVSHDLRAPLRAIDGFTRILIEDHVSKLGKEGKRLGSIIQNNAKKMGQLIDDLLTFSRLGRASTIISPIDMKIMVNEVFSKSVTPDNQKRIKFTVADLPNINADSNMLRQVWINLITNAVKFSSHRKRAVISISYKEEKDKLTYCIKDNGAGFDMKYVDKLFGVFQRLHNEDEFEGTGVGLALVQRIIKRYDGKAWAEGVVDKGAEFYFSLPKKLETKNES